MKKRTYKTVEIDKLDLARVLAAISGVITVAIDVAKERMVVGLADERGETHALFRFSHPTQTSIFLALVERLRELGRAVAIALEPTGVYSRPLVYQLRVRGFDIYRVDPKTSHDVAGVLDGVSSQHDAKACTLIAFLHAQRISKPWRERSEREREARALADEYLMWSSAAERLCGQLEGLTASSWPELNAMIEESAKWHLHLLAAYPGPHELETAPRDEVRALLRRVGRLSPERIEQVLQTARASVGEPLLEYEQRRLRTLVTEILRLRASAAAVRKRMHEFVRREGHESIARIAEVVGPACATAIFAEVGDPASYGSAAALEKACGLNLREHSSGQHKGKLSITKRGSPRVRHLLYLASMRMTLMHPLVNAWYERRTAYAAGLKKKALVALMRKLLRALFHVGRGSTFDATKLFDVRKLGSPQAAAKSSDFSSRARRGRRASTPTHSLATTDTASSSA